MTVVEPGKWYLMVTCHHCGQGVALVEDPNQDNDPQALEYRQPKGTVTCPLCGKADVYDITEVGRAQGQPRGRLN